MKKFLKYLFIFALVVSLLDIWFGYICTYLNSHAKGGDTQNHYYIATEMSDSVLIFGSSRATHHFNPAILEDSLGQTVYNCGLDGNGIIYNYGRLLTVLDRYKPKMIIYDVIPGFDIAEDDYSKYLKWLRRWYDIPGVSEIFHDVDSMEDFEMLSNLYRYNSVFIQMLSDNLRPLHSISYKGYQPLDGTIDYDVKPKESEVVEWSDLKMKYFTKFVDRCKENNITLIISYSPWYKATDSDAFSEFTKFAEDNALEVIDMYNDPEFVTNGAYFEDASHLNSEGADLFTSKFANALNKVLGR